MVMALPMLGQSKSSARLTPNALANMRYRLVDGTWNASVKLSDGEGQVTRPDGIDSFWLKKEFTAFGDLNKDGVDGAIVVIVYSGGGSGFFYYLVAVTNHNGKGEVSAARNLGDRIKIKSIKIKHGVVTVDMITQGPNDGLCCPTQPQVLKLALQGKQFAEMP
jgi:hypothetical protein